MSVRRISSSTLVDACWLTKHGYSTALRSRYVEGGWLQQPARQVYTRSRSPLSWLQVVISLQLRRFSEQLKGDGQAIAKLDREAQIEAQRRVPGDRSLFSGLRMIRD
nr:AbiEi antitoxin N-terminal domain-containing protein [Bradyrhizobium sp. CCBAU 51627]